MVLTRDISMFIEKNNFELRSIVFYLCRNLGYAESPEDIVQDIYLKIITKKTLEIYREDDSRLGTFLFDIIRKYILGKYKTNEYLIFNKQIYAPIFKDIDFYQKHEKYQSTLDHNHSSDDLIGLKAHLNTFARFLRQSRYNKRYKLKLRGHQEKSFQYLGILQKLKEKDSIKEQEFKKIQNIILNAGKEGYTLLEFFQLLYKGYTYTEIALIYGISKMSVFNMKRRLSQVLIKFGIMTA